MESVKNGTNNTKQKLVFVSHSSNDKNYANLLVSLMNKLGITNNSIFCSSLPDNGLELSEVVFEGIKNKIVDNEVLFIILHSRNYYKSPICLNEMGAAWVLSCPFISILLPGFDSDEMKGVINNKNELIKMREDRKIVNSHVDMMIKMIMNHMGVNTCEQSDLGRDRDDFIDGVESEYKKNSNCVVKVGNRKF